MFSQGQLKSCFFGWGGGTKPLLLLTKANGNYSIFKCHSTTTSSRAPPTEARHSLEDCLEADLLHPQVAVAQQAAPQEHPVQARAVVHDDDAALARDEAVARYDHLHAKHQLQQRLETRGQRGERTQRL